MQIHKRLAALERLSSPPVIFVQFETERPGLPRQLADGQPVDRATFETQLASAGAAAIVVKVKYDGS